MDSIYTHADLLRVYKALLNGTQEIAIWLRGNTGMHLKSHFLSQPRRLQLTTPGGMSKRTPISSPKRSWWLTLKRRKSFANL